MNCSPRELESGHIAKHSETRLKLGPIYLPLVIECHQYSDKSPFSDSVITNIIAYSCCLVESVCHSNRFELNIS